MKKKFNVKEKKSISIWTGSAPIWAGGVQCRIIAHRIDVGLQWEWSGYCLWVTGSGGGESTRGRGSAS